MAYINGNHVNFSSYVIDEGNYYNKTQTAQVISNPNLLINGDFRVNQRGQTTYSFDTLPAYTRVYTVDRWRFTPQVANSKSTVIQNANSLSIYCDNQYDNIAQLIENVSILAGKTITYSINVKSASSLGFIMRISANNSVIKSSNLVQGINYCTATLPSSLTDVKADIVLVSGSQQTIEIEWAKLEIGSVATAFSPRPYAEELALCQRYFTPIKFQGGAISASNQGTLLYPVFFTPVQMRTTPTLNINQMPEIRGNGQSGIIPTKLTPQNIVGNELQFIVEASGMTNLHVYILTNGNGTLDAEIY